MPTSKFERKVDINRSGSLFGGSSLSDSCGADNSAYSFYLCQETAELRQIGCFKGEENRYAGIIVIRQADCGNIYLFVGYQSGDISHKPDSVPCLNLDLNRVESIGVPPFHGDKPVLFFFIDNILAVLTMYGYSPAPGDISNDFIARYRMAALTQLSE